MAVSGNSDDSQDEKSSVAIRKRDRAKFITQQVKSGVQELLHGDDYQKSEPENEILKDAAFDPQKALEPEEVSKSSLRDRVSVGVQNVTNSLKNPKAVSRNRYARNVATKVAKHTYDLSTAYDDELLDAHDTLMDIQEQEEKRQLEDSEASSVNSNTDRLIDAQSQVEHIEQRRDDFKSGWILGRHVKRAKVVRSVVSRPMRSQFLTEPLMPDHPPHLQKRRYIGHLALWYTRSFTAHRIDDFDEPPFDLAELALTIERLAAISSPWQSFYAKIRNIYRWTDPMQTAQIMFIYWLVWYFKQVMPFCVASMIYLTIQNKFKPTSIQSVRERVERSRDQTKQVRAWAELISKHGKNDWVEPLLDELGPYLQLQLGDLATFLERLQNFYRWERPSHTLLTLMLLFICFMFMLLASMELCISCFWFTVGSIFFFSFPIATNYPKYRHVVDPLNWLFWGVPDSAELAISQLQEKVVLKDAARLAALKKDEDIECSRSSSSRWSMSNLIAKTSTKDNLEHIKSFQDTDRLSFQVVVLPLHSTAEITLTRTGFSIIIDEQSSVSYLYKSLVEMRKVDINKDIHESSSSANNAHLSRSTRVARLVEKATKMQVLPDGLEFELLRDGENEERKAGPGFEENDNKVDSDITDCKQDLPAPAADVVDSNLEQTKKITLVLSRTDRDRIFTIVLAWSNLRWQPLFSMNRQNKLGNRHIGTDSGGNERRHGIPNDNLDDAIKRILA